jgi:murein L,D-transpeptidase YafK
VPQNEPALLLVSTERRRMRIRLQGESAVDFEVGFGQEEGRKRRQGDLRTPLGAYFVVGKSRGPFAGPSAAYYGGHWIKINYPNAYDAEWGRARELVTREAATGIATAWRQRRPTAQGTALGGGIGLHGWADDWDLEGPRRLSWGCVVMRNADIARIFDRVPVGAMVVIF